MPALSKQIQDAVTAYLAARVALEGVTVIGKRTADIVSDIDSAVGSAGGVCIYVFPALPIEVKPNIPGPYVSAFEIRIRCIEAANLNTSLPDCFELVEEVLTALHLKAFSEVAGLNLLSTRPKPVEEIADPERTIYDVVFHASAGYSPRT
jgi:hypothetical protein